jgi:hypothetical protein
VVAIVGDSGVVLAEPLTLRMEHRLGNVEGLVRPPSKMHPTGAWEPWHGDEACLNVFILTTA